MSRTQWWGGSQGLWSREVGDPPNPLLCGLGDDTKSGRPSASSWIRCKLLHPLHGVTVKIR